METLIRLVYDELIYLKKVRNQTDFGEKLGYQKGHTSNLLSGTVKMGEEVKDTLVKKFGVNRIWLDTNGKSGEMFTKTPKKLTGADIRNKKAFGTDEEEQGLIYVPIAAQAGYSRNYEDPIFVNQLDRLYIPGLPYRGDKYRYFDVEGVSMEPTIKENMQVIGERVEQNDWKHVSNFYIYVIVTTNKILIKRVYKKNDTDIVLISDNDEYPQELMKLTDVKELWYVKRILDWRMPPPKTIKINV